MCEIFCLDFMICAIFGPDFDRGSLGWWVGWLNNYARFAPEHNPTIRLGLSSPQNLQTNMREQKWASGGGLNPSNFLPTKKVHFYLDLSDYYTEGS